jgi:hypothetical protein
MDIRPAPGQPQGRHILAIDDTPDGFEDGHAVAMALVQAFDVAVELLAQPTQAQGFGTPCLRIDCPACLPGLLQLGQHVEFPGLAGVKLKTEFAQADFAKPAVNDIQRRDLFRNEQHPFVFGKALGDEVGNCLALARAGRPDKDEILAARSGHDRREL